MLTNSVLLKDALWNLDEHSGASDEYRHGMIVGIMSAMMAGGYSFQTAWREVLQNVHPSHMDILKRCVPESWANGIPAMRINQNKPFNC